MPSAAYRELLGEIQGVPLSELLPVNLNVAAVVSTVLGVCRHIASLRREFDPLPVDLAAIDRLPSYALALTHAHSLHRIREAPAKDLAQQAEEARTLRNHLYSDALALARRGLLEIHAVRALKRTTGYRQMGFDLQSLAALFQQNWNHVAGKTATQAQELERAAELGSQLLQAVGRKERAPKDPPVTHRIRAQAFTLLT